MKTADAVIIGGGAIGASIAYHLAHKGLKNIIVIDKGNPGSGSTGRATGGFRAQFGSEINIKLSLLSREKLHRFKEETGVDPGFLQQGYLFIALDDDELSRLKHANRLQKAAGLDDAEIVTADDIEKINPHIHHTGIIGGAFCKSDGFITPLKMLNGFKAAAERLGAQFLYNVEVLRLQRNNNLISSVETSNGNYSAPLFINAAGAWAGKIAEFAEVNIPITPLKRQVCRIEQKNILPGNLPMTVWVKDSFHFRIRDEHLILLHPSEPENPDCFNTEIEDSWLEKTFNTGLERIPALKNSRTDRSASWAGLYEMSPDEHIMLGLAAGIENFYLANGSSGHGVMHSPAIGQLLAELITGEKTSIDISSLSPNRFKEGKPISQIEFF